MPRPRTLDGLPELKALKVIRYLYIDVEIDGKLRRFRQNYDGQGSWMKWVDGYWTMPAPHEDMAIQQALENNDEWNELEAARNPNANLKPA